MKTAAGAASDHQNATASAAPMTAIDKPKPTPMFLRFSRRVSSNMETPSQSDPDTLTQISSTARGKMLAIQWFNYR